ncbi:helix-turn-helix domain-containing protein [Microbacterium betulae]|uniref:Helix-turn-helix domain-containing protein n=1 Tax=Microbacterium betulae TaxID=2981139 RepID=A0AA97FIG7_9MICO|nr:helix-turn-helix domain-containing protein [Microbacterium sp. AB]WOF23209.1 helix-turn-helix domain-containing protein [Microbacterium sp. AB]
MAESDGTAGRKARPDAIPTIPAKQLKAKAHPVRLQLEHALGRRGFARAADLAADLGLPANQISFHLRVLADAGLIEEAPEHARDRRDRVWRPARMAWQLGSPEHPVEDEHLGGALLHAIVGEHQDLVRRVVEWAPEYSSGRTREIHGTFNQYSLWLTDAEWVALLEKIGEAIDEVRDLHQPGEDGARRWSIDLIAADDEI